jgi:hypothetical protein
VRTRQRRCPHRLRNVRFIRLRAQIRSFPQTQPSNQSRRKTHLENVSEFAAGFPHDVAPQLHAPKRNALRRSVTLIGRGHSGRRKSHDTGVRRRRHESQFLMALCGTPSRMSTFAAGMIWSQSDRIRALTVDIAATGQGQLHCHSLKYSDPSARQVAKKRLLSKYFLSSTPDPYRIANDRARGGILP